MTHVLSVERDNRSYYLTTDKNPNGPGLLCVISLGSPQKGDREIAVCDVEICKNMKAAKQWYRRQMKDKPWQKIAQIVEVPKGLGGVSGLRVANGKLVADTESGVPMVVPLGATDR